MNRAAIISKLNTMEATARLLIEEAITLRRELERLNAPAPRKGRLNAEKRAMIAKAIARREKLFLKKIK